MGLGCSFNTCTPSLCNSRWLDLTLEFWLWRATSSMLIFYLIGFLNHFSHFLGERKKGKAERSKQVTREIKGAGILWCWVSSCVLPSHLVWLICIFSYSRISLVLISIPDKHFAKKCSGVIGKGGSEDSAVGCSPRDPCRAGISIGKAGLHWE